MKLLKLIFILLLLNPRISNAQPEWGLKGGINQSMIEGGGVIYSSTWKTGIQGGFTSSFSLSKNLFIRPELLFVQKGGNLDYVFMTSSTTDVFVDGSQRIYYLELPVTLERVVFRSRSGAAYLIGFGLFGSYGVGGKVSYNETVTSSNNPNSSTTEFYEEKMKFKYETPTGNTILYSTSHVQNLDYGLQVSVSFRNVNKHVELSYSQGTYDINQDAFNGVLVSRKTSRSIQLSYGLYLNKRWRRRADI